MSQKRALVLGATGLIGSSLVKQLLEQEHYREIRIVARRSLGISHPKCSEKLIHFEQLSDQKAFFQVDDLFCCLGTTIKKAKTRERFRKIDFTYPLEAAKLARSSRVKQFSIVTAMNANPTSPFFYSRVKGELEQELQRLQLPSTHIFRPSLLLGERTEFRLGETVGQWLAKPLTMLMHGPLTPYRPIAAHTVAKAMIHVANQGMNGYHMYHSQDIERLAILPPFAQ